MFDMTQGEMTFSTNAADIVYVAPMDVATAARETATTTGTSGKVMKGKLSRDGFPKELQCRSQEGGWGL